MQIARCQTGIVHCAWFATWALHVITRQGRVLLRTGREGEFWGGHWGVYAPAMAAKRVPTRAFTALAVSAQAVLSKRFWHQCIIK